MSQFTAHDVPVPPDASALGRFSFDPPDSFRPLREYHAAAQAQDFVYEAWEAPTPSEKLQLCIRALDKFPFCVDAYNAIGESYRNEFEDLDKAKEAFGYARECACIQWPSIEHEEDISWGQIEFRPFLRALHGLGSVLLDKGETKDALRYFRFMLKKNPNDNQGVRMLLFQALIETGEYKEAEEISKKHSNGRQSSEVFFRYGFVLIDYLKNKLGACSDEEVHDTLVQALQNNPFVVPLLLKDFPLGENPPYISPGSLDEATNYVHATRKCWKRVAGALEWLQKLRFRQGLKPKDDGLILFGLLAKGRVALQASNQSEDMLVATSNVAMMPGRGLAEFSLPVGMKTHSSAKMVCMLLHSSPPPPENETRHRFLDFSYDEVESVPFWYMLQTSKVFGSPEDGRRLP